MGGVTGLLSGGLGLASKAAGKGGGKGGDSSSSGDPAQAEFANMEALNKIRARYADLGLGGSTMEAMDEGGQTLASLAEQNQLQNQNQQTANQTLSTLGSLANQQGGNAGFSSGFQTGGTPGAATGGAGADTGGGLV